jgi:hypothetical protein
MNPEFISPLRCSFEKTLENQGGIVVAKTLAKLTIGFVALATLTCFGTSSSLAFGDAPWCAVINIGVDVYWDCEYRTVEECIPNVLAG